MKSIWKGSISFGLVNIPIKLYSAIEPKEFKFRLICRKSNTPIRYKRYCDACKKEIKWDQIDKGIEIAKDEYITIPKEQLSKIKPEKSDTIDVLQIVDAYQIESIYLNSHYFIAPEKPKEKAYFLLQEVLRETAKIAIAKFVMKEKEYACTISPYRNGLLLTTLNYAYEVRDIKKIEEMKEEPKLTKEEYALARQLINKLYTDSFEFSKMKDTFSEKMRETIVKLQKGETIKVKKSPKKSKKTLIEALRASVK